MYGYSFFFLAKSIVQTSVFYLSLPLSLFFFFGRTLGMQKFPGQGRTPWSHSNDTPRSLTCCATWELLYPLGIWVFSSFEPMMNDAAMILYRFGFFCLFFSQPHLQHMEVPRPGVKSEPQLQQYHQILNPLCHNRNSIIQVFVTLSECNHQSVIIKTFRRVDNPIK